MSINWPFAIVSLVVIELMVHLWLVERQRRTLLRNRSSVPAAFAEHLSLEEHQKAADYGEARLRLGQLKKIFSTAVMLTVLLTGVIGYLDAKFLEHVQGIAQPLLFLGFLAVVSTVIGLPWSWYSHFTLEEKYGFNRMTPQIFWADQLKGLVLTFILGGAILAPFLWLMKVTGPLWIIPALGIWVAFQLLIMGIGMRVIAPLFNKFTPLANEDLKLRIAQLVEDAGFHAQGVFVMDASKRSGHGNAYFTGIGRHKRIVFFDTLMDKISSNQILAVLAHEIGHLRHGHIWKGFLFSVVFSSIGFIGLAWLQTQTELFAAFGMVPNPGPLFVMAGWLAPLITFPLTPFFSWRSRKHEFQADQYAVGKTSAKDLGDALLALHRDNASSVVHDELYSAMFFSHPPLARRLKEMGHSN